jgi:hypothetical protein
MGTLLAFPTAPRTRRPALSPDEARGTVLLFTGVRYERHAPVTAPEGDGEGSKPGRRARRG